MRNKSATIGWLCVSLILFLLANVVNAMAAQQEKETARSAVPAPAGSVAVASPAKPDHRADAASKPTSDVLTETDRIRALERALQLQNEKLEAMQRLIEEQQRMLQLLNAGPATTASPARDNAAAREPAAEAPMPVPQTQQPTLEERVKKVEERVTKLGPIHLSGDFRLRLDGTLRAATSPPDPPIQHLQNVRLRYRLRLNLDSDLNKAISFHGQLSTGPINNPLTLDQDFTSTVAHHPFFINEAWIDYHPNKTVALQGGRVQEVFADSSRFLFDDDLRFNGFSEKFILPFGNKGTSKIELRAGQYWFSNPNVAVITAGSPLAVAGDEIGKIGRSSNLFHQGLVLTLKSGEDWTHQLGGDVQVFREPNQIQLASTANGVVLIVQPGLGLTLSGPMTGTGNATTTSGGAIYTAENFHVARLTYRLDHSGFKAGEHAYPIMFNVQAARNFGTSARERDAMLASIQVGKPAKFGDMSFLYVFAIKGANSIISQLTDDDLGTVSGVNLRTHYVRWELGLAKNITLQSLLFVQRELRNSGQFPNFFVPLGAFTPRQYRFQEQVLFTF
jgi:Putative porin